MDNQKLIESFLTAIRVEKRAESDESRKTVSLR
jgi:hypothetical protein